MIISERYKFIFGGIGRSGATSLHEVLKVYNKYEIRKNVSKKFHKALFQSKPRKGDHIRKHAPFEVAKAYIPDFDSYYKFCIFRNPWDMAVSKYFYHGGSKCSHRDGYGRTSICKDAREMSFLDWVKVPGYTDIVPQVPIRTQRDFITDADDNIIVDEVFSFGHIYSIQNVLKERFSIEVKIPVLNQTQHKHYTQYYQDDSEAIGAVRDQHRWAINRMRFVFGKERCPYVSRSFKKSKEAGDE